MHQRHNDRHCPITITIRAHERLRTHGCMNTKAEASSCTKSAASQTGSSSNGVKEQAHNRTVPHLLHRSWSSVSPHLNQRRPACLLLPSLPSHRSVTHTLIPTHARTVAHSLIPLLSPKPTTHALHTQSLNHVLLKPSMCLIPSPHYALDLILSHHCILHSQLQLRQSPPEGGAHGVGHGPPL